MKTLLAVALVFVAASVVLAKGQGQESPAGKPPWGVENGRATLVGHFGNAHQMLRLAIGLRPPHLAEEEQFLKELMTPGSPQFHKFLTAKEWDARFAPSVADEQAVVDWAKSEGMTITHRYPNRLIVDVEGPIGILEKALHVKINNYKRNGYTYYSNDRAPVLPPSISGIIRSINGLDNMSRPHPATSHGPIPPGPMYTPGPVAGPAVDAGANASGTAQPPAQANLGAATAVPNFTSGYDDPKDIFSPYAYDYDALQNLHHCCNPFHVGGGSPPQASIALATYGNLHTSTTTPTFPDIAGFQSLFPYLAYYVTTISVDGGPTICTVTAKQSCDNDFETALDTEWSLATANSFGSFNDTAHVYVYEDGGSAEDMYNLMLTDGKAKTFSTSWSNTEISSISGSEMDTRHAIFNSMVGQGWTLMTASGDRGATDDCSTLSVSYPASDPDMVGVGGTRLIFYTDGTFDKETAWTGGSAAKSCTGNNGGSGGGCSAYFLSPNYQSGDNVACGGFRSVPDIALNSSVGQLMYFNGHPVGTAGTSIAAPEVAGFFAQEGAYLTYLGHVTGNHCGPSDIPCGPMGNGNTYFYDFGLTGPGPALPHYPFYDITSGCNSNDITATKGLTAYCAGPGYDSVTGWGTANMLQLAWAINTYIAGDLSAPDLSFTGPTVQAWYRTPQAVRWTIAPKSANGAVPNGVAGFSDDWDTTIADDTSEPTPGSGNAFYSGPQSPLKTSGSLALDSNEEGCHTAHVRAWDNGGRTETVDRTYGPVCYDDIPPVIHCAAPDGLWHAEDVSLACTASDDLSGLANPSDASFRLETSVAAGAETASAYTKSSTVYDMAGNEATAGPLGPNRVDKKPPRIGITSPTGTPYTHSSMITLDYSVTDGGSGVGVVTPTMDGSTTLGGGNLASGTSINLLTELPLGVNTFAIAAADKVSNRSSASVSFTIVATASSLIADVNEFYADGAISSADVYSGLLNKLNAALPYWNAGQCGPADHIYSSFIHQVNAQTGKAISPAAAAILIGDAEYLMGHCP